jgi:hypothetical protein
MVLVWFTQRQELSEPQRQELSNRKGTASLIPQPLYSVIRLGFVARWRGFENFAEIFWKK